MPVVYVHCTSVGETSLRFSNRRYCSAVIMSCNRSFPCGILLFAGFC